MVLQFRESNLTKRKELDIKDIELDKYLSRGGSGTNKVSFELFSKTCATNIVFQLAAYRSVTHYNKSIVGWLAHFINGSINYIATNLDDSGNNI